MTSEIRRADYRGGRGSSGALVIDLVESVLHSRWAYAIPMPIFFALSGTLVGKCFSEMDEGAETAANFVVSGFILIPATLLFAYVYPESPVGEQKLSAVLLLLIGTLAAAAAGRAFYQVALSATNNDNGFVMMFFCWFRRFPPSSWRREIVARWRAPPA